MTTDKQKGTNSVYKMIGASNHTDKEREINDYYATDPIAIDVLIKDGKAEIAHKVWECACGEGHLSERLKQFGYDVYSTDLIERGYGKSGVDFLTYNGMWDGDIITNPPYAFAYQFVEKAIDVINKGNKVFMLLRINFLEGKKRRQLFEQYPPKTVYISSGRILCAKNAEFDKMKAGGGSAVAYAWFEWKKGFTGNPIIKWIN